MGILPGSGPLGSGPTGPGSGFSVMPHRSPLTRKKLARTHSTEKKSLVLKQEASLARPKDKLHQDSYCPGGGGCTTYILGMRTCHRAGYRFSRYWHQERYRLSQFRNKERYRFLDGIKI